MVGPKYATPTTTTRWSDRRENDPNKANRDDPADRNADGDGAQQAPLGVVDIYR